MKGIQIASSSILHASVEMDEYHYTSNPDYASKIAGPDQAPDTKGEAPPSATLHEGSLNLQKRWKQPCVSGWLPGQPEGWEAGKDVTPYSSPTLSFLWIFFLYFIGCIIKLCWKIPINTVSQIFI